MAQNPTPKRRERLLENADREATAARFVRALGRHVGDGDPDDLALFRELDLEVRAALGVAVVGLRRQGYSWEDIARALGITRQAAWERYANLSPTG